MNKNNYLINWGRPLVDIQEQKIWVERKILERIYYSSDVLESGGDLENKFIPLHLLPQMDCMSDLLWEESMQ